jgi:hypothetical protein
VKGNLDLDRLPRTIVGRKCLNPVPDNCKFRSLNPNYFTEIIEEKKPVGRPPNTADGTADAATVASARPLHAAATEAIEQAAEGTSDETRTKKSTHCASQRKRIKRPRAARKCVGEERLLRAVRHIDSSCRLLASNKKNLK